MSRVSHFQRFSQAENHATNNTLLVLRHLYQAAPHKLQGLLTSLIEVDLSIGLTFEQQIRGSASVPDALIMQQALRIFIETKRGGAIDADQIRRHLMSMDAAVTKGGRTDVLVALTKEPIPDALRDGLRAAAAGHGTAFAAVTFTQLAEGLRAQCADFERDLLAIIEDYEAFLAEDGLLDERNQWLVVFPCGTSIAENARFGVYYEPPSRPIKRNYRYIGIYAQKTVAYVGAVETIAIATPGPAGARLDCEVGTLTEAQAQRIRDTIAATSYYDLAADPYRFYLVDGFFATDARKTSAGGIQGFRYLDLTRLIPGHDRRRSLSGAELAALLGSARWE